jgi:hypothetical protein
MNIDITARNSRRARVLAHLLKVPDVDSMSHKSTKQQQQKQPGCGNQQQQQEQQNLPTCLGFFR